VVDPYTTRPTNYIQLLQHIAHTKTLGRLISLLEDYGGHFDALHVAAAISVVPRLLGPAVERGRGLAPAVAAKPRQLLEQLQVGGLGGRFGGRLFWGAGAPDALA
jgi:hypothetical protein